MIRETLWMLRYARRSLSGDLLSLRRDVSEWRRFWRSFGHYQHLAPQVSQHLLDYLYPCLGDDIQDTPVEPVYFYQDAWAFKNITSQRPRLHVDVGSHHKFVALLSTVVPTIMVDLRPLSLSLESLQFKQGSILGLPFQDASLQSISSLCVVEHIGLGRYGDPLDPCGTEKAVSELKRVVQPGGDLYISVPLDDDNRTYFNAHRAFQEDYFLGLLEPFHVVERRYICGRSFAEERMPGFGTGCYHVRRLL